MGLKDLNSFTAKVAMAAKENKSFNAKEMIIGSKAKPEGREETAPRVAYRWRFGVIDGEST